MACEGFPHRCPNLIDVSDVGSLKTTFICGCETPVSRDIPVVMTDLTRCINELNALFQEMSALVYGDEKSVVHACPPDDSGLMPCCLRNPMDVAPTDRITRDPQQVTCQGADVT